MSKPWWRTRKWRWLMASKALVIAPIGLFILNGTLLCGGEIPRAVTTKHPPKVWVNDDENPAILKVMSYNIAKAFAYKGSMSFEDTAVVAQRIDAIAAMIRAENPDLVFLSEALTEAGPCRVNQVSRLAEPTGMHVWAFGENFNVGLPLFRVVGENAILSKLPLKAISNPSLAGRKPFYMTKNNRRVLWCEVDLAGQRVLLGSVHNDSFNPRNNLTQTRELLDAAAAHTNVMMAGDFNAEPGEPSIDLLRESGRFSGEFAGPFTFPTDNPSQRIDLILAPAQWELLEHRVIDSGLSDHLPVVSVFRVHAD